MITRVIEHLLQHWEYLRLAVLIQLRHQCLRNSPATHSREARLVILNTARTQCNHSPPSR